jgi:phage shock protein PspC (stress-responsive transcriptional regulator)
LTGYAASHPSRLEQHVDLLGIFWIAYSALSLIGGVAVYIVAQVIFGRFSRVDNGAPAFLHPLLVCVAIFLLLKAFVGIAAGVGLRQRVDWARVLAIVLGFFELLHVPLGTGLGIYTIWVLLSPNAEKEYRSLPQTA